MSKIQIFRFACKRCGTVAERTYVKQVSPYKDRHMYCYVCKKRTRHIRILD